MRKRQQYTLKRYKYTYTYVIYKCCSVILYKIKFRKPDNYRVNGFHYKYPMGKILNELHFDIMELKLTCQLI